MKLRLIPYQLALKKPFTTSRGTTHSNNILIVEIEHNGFKGYGEACEHGYFGVSIESMVTILESVRPKIEQLKDVSPEWLWNYLNPILQQNRFAQCALDEAMHDCYGKANRQPTYQMQGLVWKNIPYSNYTISIDDLESTINEVKNNTAKILKIKLGGVDDMIRMKMIKKHTSATLRIDANAGWTVDQTIEYSQILQALAVEFIEQPLPVDDWEGMEIVKKRSALPIIADESCLTLQDVEKCARYFDGINVKLLKCGGLTPAYQMIKKAKSLGLTVIAGCMSESSIGISALAQLLPLLDNVDMDAATFIQNDPAIGIYIDEMGLPVLNDVNGNGVSLRFENG